MNCAALDTTADVTIPSDNLAVAVEVMSRRNQPNRLRLDLTKSASHPATRLTRASRRQTIASFNPHGSLDVGRISISSSAYFTSCVGMDETSDSYHFPSEIKGCLQLLARLTITLETKPSARTDSLTQCGIISLQIKNSSCLIA